MSKSIVLEEWQPPKSDDGSVDGRLPRHRLRLTRHGGLRVEWQNSVTRGWVRCKGGDAHLPIFGVSHV